GQWMGCGSGSHKAGASIAGWPGGPLETSAQPRAALSTMDERERGMLPRLSQRTFDLMRRTLDAVDRDTGDLITTLLASAFVDGANSVRTQHDDAPSKPEGAFMVFLRASDPTGTQVGFRRPAADAAPR